MPDNVRRVKIISLDSGSPPVGVDLTDPAWQTVSLNGPVQQWTLREAGGNRYRLSVGGYPYVGVLNDKVVASTHPEHDKEWIFHQIEGRDGFNIGFAGSNEGWTVSENNEIIISGFIVGQSFPPYYPPGQLFKLE